MQSFPEITEEAMRAIKAPAFIIAGDNDVLTPEHAVAMHRMLPHSRLAILPCGHGDYIGEISTKQDSFLISSTVSMIEQFLKNTESKIN